VQTLAWGQDELKQVVDASGAGSDEGRGVAAISPGEVRSNL